MEPLASENSQVYKKMILTPDMGSEDDTLPEKSLIVQEKEGEKPENSAADDLSTGTPGRSADECNEDDLGGISIDELLNMASFVKGTEE